jgi:hypothetical protein
MTDHDQRRAVVEQVLNQFTAEGRTADHTIYHVGVQIDAWRRLVAALEATPGDDRPPEHAEDLATARDQVAYLEAEHAKLVAQRRRVAVAQRAFGDELKALQQRRIVVPLGHQQAREG